MSANLIPSVQERMLKAFLELIILPMLQNRPLTAYQIDSRIKDKFHTKMSTTVVYTRLSALERLHLIECIQIDHGKAYRLTEKGKELLSTRAKILKEIHASELVLFES